MREGESKSEGEKESMSMYTNMLCGRVSTNKKTIL